MRKKRTPLAREATVILKNWMFEVRRLPALGVGVRVEAGKGLRLSVCDLVVCVLTRLRVAGW